MLAAAAGRHVLVEKPIAISAREAGELAAAIRPDAGVQPERAVVARERAGASHHPDDIIGSTCARVWRG